MVNFSLNLSQFIQPPHKAREAESNIEQSDKAGDKGSRCSGYKIFDKCCDDQADDIIAEHSGNVTF